MLSLIPVLESIIDESEDVLLIETIGNHFDMISSSLIKYLSDSEVRRLIDLFFRLINSASGSVRRAGASGVVSICNYHSKPNVTVPYANQLLQKCINDENEGFSNIMFNFHSYRSFI